MTAISRWRTLEIVKGYEYTKGKYLTVEPDEIANLRIETKNVIDVQQFVDEEELPLALFEKPYFVVPDPKETPDAFAVVRKAMEETGKAAIGEIAFGGREHLVAIAVPENRAELGLMAYLLRYAEELRDSSEYFSQISAASSRITSTKSSSPWPRSSSRHIRTLLILTRSRTIMKPRCAS